MQRSGPRRIDNSEHVLNTWSDILRGTGLEVSIAVEDGQPEEVLLRRSREASVNCVFVAPHFGRTDVRDGSGLSEVTNALILGAECSVEVVRASSSNEQHLKPAA